MGATMTKKLLASLGAVLVVVMAMIATPAAAQDPGPIGGALATLAAATANAQIIRQQQEATYAAQRATVQAILIEQTRTAAQVQATATAISAQATQSALDELNRQRAMTATVQHSEMIATSTALAQSEKATATSQAMNEQATREAYHATATSQAVMIAAQATDTAKLSQTYATRQERFSVGLLIVELGFIAGALLILGWLTRTLVLWAKRLAPQPVSDAPNLAEVLTDSKPEPTVIEQPAEPEPRMPSTVTVFDDPRMVEALDRWAERYDAEHEVNYGN